MEAIENLIRVYRSEIEMAKQSAEYWKDKIPLTYQVAVQRQISYERVVEDLQKLAYANQALQLQQGGLINQLPNIEDCTERIVNALQNAQKPGVLKVSEHIEQIKEDWNGYLLDWVNGNCL